MLARFTSVLLFLALMAAPAAAQPTIVVVPWSTTDVDAAVVRAATDRVSLAIPPTAGTVVSVAETRTRFETLGSSPPPSVTSEELDQWATYSRAAVHALADADYAAARAQLQRAQAISDRAAAAMSREETRARQVLDTCLYGVRAYVEQEDPRAEEQMLGCRRLVPHIAPSPRIHTPEVMDVLARVDQRLASEHRGPLTVESQPAACTVRLNGVALGTTPFTNGELAGGEYRVQVECGDDDGRVHRVTISDAGGPVTLRVDARFERVVQTDAVLRLVYADAADAEVHRLADAAEAGRVVGATEVWLVGVSTSGALRGERVRVEDGSTIASAAADDGSATALALAMGTAPAGTEPVPSHGGDVQAGTWVLLSVGAAAAIAGGVMIGVGVPDLNATMNPRPTDTFDTARARQDTAFALCVAGGVSLGVGVILAGVGVGLAVADTSSGGGTEPHARLRIGPSGVSVEGTF